MSGALSNPKASGAFNIAAGLSTKLFSGPDPSSRINSMSQGPFNYGIMMQQQAIQNESDFAEKQAQLMMDEGMRAAEKKAKDGIQFREEQANQYNGSGVTLEGSPMLVLEDTRQKVQEEATAIARSATANADFIRRRSVITSNSARAALLGAQNSFYTQQAATKMASAGNGGLLGAFSQMFGGSGLGGVTQSPSSGKASKASLFSGGASNASPGLYGIMNRLGAGP